MPTYTIQLPGGKEVDYEGDAPPDSVQYAAILKSQGLSEPQAEPSSGLVAGLAKDIPLGLAKGVVGLGESAVGMADIAHRLNPVSALADVAGMDIGSIGNMLGELGYKPKETKQILSGLQSKELRDQQKRVEEAKGFVPTAIELAKNPRAVADLLAESAPSMMGGGAAARTLSKFAPAAGAAIGEGALGAGSMAEGIRQETGNLTPEQAAISLGSGAATAGLSVAGGAAARKLGLADVDVMIASGKIGKAEGSRLKRAILGAASEGVIEEMPQSAQEQASRNIALGQPTGQGVPEAAASGMIVGGAMGGGSNILSGAQAKAPPAAKSRRDIVATMDSAAGSSTSRGASTSANEIATGESPDLIQGYSEMLAKRNAERDELAKAEADKLDAQIKGLSAEESAKVFTGNPEEIATMMEATREVLPVGKPPEPAAPLTMDDVNARFDALNQQLVERYWRAKKELTESEQNLKIKETLEREKLRNIDAKEQAGKDEDYAQELAVEVSRQEGVPFSDVIKSRAQHPNLKAWVEDLESRFVKEYPVAGQPTPRSVSDIVQSARTKLRSKNLADYESSVADKSERARINVKAGLGETLEGFQPVEPKASLEFGEEVVPPPEVQAGQGLDYLMKVRQIQADLAKQGVDLPRETAVKLANLAPEEFVRARQQLIDSVPKTEKPAKGDVKLKSLSELEPTFFPPGEDFPQATPQKIAAESIHDKLESIKFYKKGMVPSGDPFTLSWDAAITTVQLAIKAGARVAEAVKVAIDHLKKSFPDATQEQINELTNKIIQSFEPSGKQVGIHLGDLGFGKDTAAGRMSGRSTGHFGTGVYFTSEQGMSSFGRSDRPVNKIDFSKFNLWTPGRYMKESDRVDSARNMHKALGKVNKMVDHQEDASLLREAAFTIALEAGKIGDVDKISDIIKKAVKDTDTEIAAKEARNTSKFIDSASTRVMKALGYEGINVLGLPGVDNTNMGSVIYAESLAGNKIDSVVSWLEGMKYGSNGAVFGVDPATALWMATHDGALATAQIAIKAGARVSEAVKVAIEYVKSKMPEATRDQIDELEAKISGAATTVFHGGPHDVKKVVDGREVVAFDRSKRGSGEGNASFGVGDVYAAQRKSIAEYYKDSLAQNGLFIDGVMATGNLYEAEAHLPDDQVIHWDKPMSQQPKIVREFFAKQGIEGDAAKIQSPFSFEDTYEEKLTGSTAYAMLAEKLGKAEIDDFGNIDGPDKASASAALESAGIKGIKYSDAKSRDVMVTKPERVESGPDKGKWNVFVSHDAMSGGENHLFSSEATARRFASQQAPSNYVAFKGESLDVVSKNEAPVPAEQRYRAQETTDSIINWLEGRKLSEPGMTFSAETAIIVKSWDLAIDVAIAAIKAGASIAQATSRAIAEFKKNYPNASQEQVDLLAEEIAEMDSGSKKQRAYVQNVWRPLLTDFSKSAIAQRKDAAGAAMRWFGETKVAQAIETGARLMKNAGTVADNIVNVLPAAKGVFSKMNQALSDALVLWTDKALPPIAEARKVFGDKFDDFSRLLISRTFTADSTGLDALVAATPGGAEILAKIESNEGWGGVREAMFNAEKNVRQGNDSFSKQADYYPLVVADGKLEDLLDMVSRHGDRHEVEKVLNQAKRDKAKETGNPGAELTREEQGAIIGKHLFGTLFQGRGAPGFTKKRNIGAITAEMAKFIEPIDVAIETRIMQVAKDVTARQFFGKIDTSGDNILPTDIESTSPFGLVLADAIKNNQITPEGIDVILDNVRDYFSNNRGASSAAWKFGRFIGDMAVYAHLNSFQSAFINASDAFSTAAREGPLAAGQALTAAVGKRISKIPGLSSFAPEDYTTLKDIKFHEGAMDTADYMRGSGVVKKFLRDSMKFIQGSMDTFGKEVALNAARINASNVMRGGDKERSSLATRDQQFERIQDVMSKTHPDVWPKMKKSLESEGFAKNDLDDMGRLYLRERLSDAQPMTRAEQAQGKLATHPGFKPIFALKSFMLRQIGTIRNNTYEELKKGNVAEAATWFGVYALWTMAGQVIVRCMVAKSLGKDCGGLDSWLSAFTGIFGMNKYSLSGLTRGDPAGTAVDMFTPPLTPVNSLFKDVMLTRDTITGRKMEGTNRPVVRNIGDFLKQAESYKHLPGGKDVYELVGAGRTKELKRQAEEKRGKKSSTITEELGKLILPPPKKSN